MYILTLKKKKSSTIRPYRCCSIWRVKKANANVCSNCLTWHLDFSENRNSSSPAGQRPSQRDGGILCTGSLFESSPLPFHDFRSFKWTRWTCSLGRGKCFIQFSDFVFVAKLNVWLASCGKRNPVCDSSDWGCHQCALGLERILLVGAFSFLYCYCERAVSIISWNVYSLGRVTGRALERYPNLIWASRPYGNRHLQHAKKSGTGFSSHV